MATITYLNVDKTAEEVTIKGVKFKADKPVTTNDKELIEKFKSHPHFKVSGDYDPNKPSVTEEPEDDEDQAQNRPQQGGPSTKPAPSSGTTTRK